MKQRYIFAGVVTLTFYIALPFIMGAREIGFRRGPVFYPKWLHEGLFIAGCEAFNGYKPRESTVQILYRRALFYGLPERKKSESECASIKAELKARNSPLLNMIEESERQAEERRKRMAEQATTGNDGESSHSSTEPGARRP